MKRFNIFILVLTFLFLFQIQKQVYSQEGELFQRNKSGFTAGPLSVLQRVEPFDVIGNVTVFIYHRFDEARYPTTNVSIDQFQQQLNYLKAQGHSVLPLLELYSLLSVGGRLPEKAAVITVDDGYKSVYEKAWPVLKSFGFPFTVFLYVEATDKGHEDYMTWDQIRELQGQGVDFQSHGYSHRRIGSPMVESSDDAAQETIRADFTKSAAIIEKQLGYAPSLLATPYGEYNQTVVSAARSAGYQGLLTQDPGSVSIHTDPFSMPREPILGNEWSTLQHFIKVMERVDLPLMMETPAAGLMNGASPPRFGGRILYPERYLQGSLGVYISELGWQPADLQDGYVTVENSRALTRRMNRVAVSGREKNSGRTAIRFWLLINGAHTDL